MLIAGKVTPKPSDEEIARVSEWQRVEKFMKIQALAESLYDKHVKASRVVNTWHGVPIDDLLSKKALLGIMFNP